MKKVTSANGKLKLVYCIEANEDYHRTSRSVYKNDAGEYYLIESMEYNIGSACDYVNTCYALDEKEAEYYENKARIPALMAERMKKLRKDT